MTDESRRDELRKRMRAYAQAVGESDPVFEEFTTRFGVRVVSALPDDQIEDAIKWADKKIVEHGGTIPTAGAKTINVGEIYKRWNSKGPAGVTVANVSDEDDAKAEAAAKKQPKKEKPTTDPGEIYRRRSSK